MTKKFIFTLDSTPPDKALNVGTIVDVTTSGTSGTAIVHTSGGQLRPYLAFNFDKVPGYHGQSANAVGIVVGTNVEFEEKDGTIHKVKILGKN